MSNENADLKADVAGTDTQADAREGGCDTGTEGADLNWLKERIAQPGTCPPRWQHVLDLTDVVEVLRGSDIESAALERHLAAEQSKMDKAMRGNAAKDPREVGMRGGAVGGVQWLAMAIAHHVILGRSLAGHDVLETGPVIHFTKEDSYDIIDHRRWHMIHQNGYTEAEREKLFENFICVSPQEIGLPDQQSKLVNAVNGTIEETPFVGMVERYIREYRPKLIIFDPQNMYGAGERFNNDGEGALIGTLRGIVNRHKIAVLLVHHTSQASSEAKNTAITAGRGGRQADTTRAWCLRSILSRALKRPVTSRHPLKRAMPRLSPCAA